MDIFLFGKNEERRVVSLDCAVERNIDIHKKFTNTFTLYIHI